MENHDEAKYIVLAVVCDRMNRLPFGPFLDRWDAEECVKTLAARENVLSAIVQNAAQWNVNLAQEYTLGR